MTRESKKLFKHILRTLHMGSDGFHLWHFETITETDESYTALRLGSQDLILYVVSGDEDHRSYAELGVQDGLGEVWPILETLSAKEYSALCSAMDICMVKIAQRGT